MSMANKINWRVDKETGLPIGEMSFDVANAANVVEAVEQFYTDSQSGKHPAFEPYIAQRGDEIYLDGRFTLGHLKRIVTAWEQYEERYEKARKERNEQARQS